MKNRIKNFFPSLTFSSPLLTSLFPLLLTFLTLFAASVASAQIPSAGLVGYWPFNGNANDESGNGNNGTVNGATLTTDRFGNANSAYSFDGVSSVININSQFGNFGAGDFTFSTWAKLNLTSQGGRVIVGKRDAPGYGNFYQFGYGNNGAFYEYNVSSPGDLSYTMGVGPVSYTWVQMTYVRQGQNTSIYQNGVLVQTFATGMLHVFGNNSVFSIGARYANAGLAQVFDGLIDDICVWGRALTPAEITQVYTSQTSTVQPPCPTLATNLQTGLVGYWPFCGNANDESGNGNNGTVNGAVASLCPDRDGNLNSAYNFQNALGGITVNSFDFPEGNYTVSAWVNVTLDPAAVSSKNIISHDWNNGGEMILFLNEPTSQSVNFDCKPNTGNSISASVNSNEWNHLVMQRLGLIFRLYLNGVLIQEGNKASMPIIPNNNLFFGGDPVGTQYSLFNGKLDDISIYNRALTPAEITQLYTDQTSLVEIPCTPFLGEDQTVCAGTSVTISASGSSLACPTLPSTLQNGLVGYWPFCGNANDASGNGNNGTVNGATLTTDRFGNANSALEFTDGTQIMCTNVQINNPTEFTSFAWFNSASSASTGPEGLGRIFGFDDGQCQHIFSQDRYIDLTSTGQVRFFINHTSGNYFIYSSPGKNDGNWHSVACTFGSNGMKLYVDGILEASNSNNLVSSYNGFWRAGGLNNSYSPSILGLVDDISLHNRVLTAAEILTLHQATSGSVSYSWSTGATTATINVTPSTTTTYTCTVTDANGNVCTDSVTVFVPQIEATDLTICAGESTTLSVSGINSTATPSACPTLPSNLQTGLVGYWPFCGNANDVSGNGNNGTVNGATLTTDRFGNANSAYSFDGVNDYINAPRPVLNEFTISFWAKLESYNCFGAFIDANNANWEFLLNCTSGGGQSTGLVEFIAWNVAGYSELSTGYVIPLNQWQNIVLEYSSNTISVFVNGVLTSQLENITFNSTVGSFNFGASISGNPQYLNGKLDDIFVFNRILSPSEIQQLYNLGQTTYLWSNGATTPTINVSPTSTTTYTCTVTTNGVSCTDSVTVVVSNPVIDLGADVTVCGTSATLTAPSGYDSYLWSNGGTTNTTTVSANGTYSCTATQGACSATDAVDVTLVNAAVSASDSTICAGQSVTLSVPQGAASSTACALLPSNLQTGLVGFWPFCGNANDVSGNGNNGTVNGATLTTDRFGNANSAYSFDGDDFIGMLATPELPACTINLFYKLNSVSDPSGFGALFSSNWYSFMHLQVGLENGSNQGVAAYPNPDSPISCVIAQYTPLTNLWRNISATYDGYNLKLYDNGILVGSNNNCGFGNPLRSSLTNYLGRGFVNSRFFNGSIDDVTLYNRALNPSEIQQIFTLGQTTYLWSNGATTPTINVSPTSTTTYTCTVTTNGVSCTDSVTVVVSNPVIDLGADVIVCGTSTTLTATSGYDSYLWSNGGTTNTTTVTANGTYSCTVTQGGCSATDAVDVTLVNATVSATDSTVCAGQSVTLSVPQGGSSIIACAALPTNLQTGLVGYWPFCGNANDASGNGNNGTVNGATLTTDRFGNANSAYSFDGNDIIQALNPLGNLSSDFTINSHVKISSWTGGLFLQVGIDQNSFPRNGFGYGFGGSQAVLPGQNLLGLLSNVAWFNSGFQFTQLNQWYFATVVRQSDNLLFYIEGALVGTVTIPSIQVPSNSIFVGGGSPNYANFNGLIDDVTIYNRALSVTEIQQLYTLGQTNYLWSNGATTPTINVSPTSTTTYTCTVTTNGVSCADSVTVVVSQPVASITPNGIVEICQGQSIALTANGGISYLWNTGAPTQSITVNTEAVYTVTVTDANGCTDTESQLVKVNLLPNIGVNNASICPGQSTTLTATGGLTYVWSPATGLSSTTGTTVTASPSTSTVYTVTGTGANGCTNTATAAVAVNAAPTATITPATTTTFCQGGSVVLNANTGAGLSYQWFNNAVAISGATTASYTANASGSYTVVVTNTSTCSATSTATVVTVNALPIATITSASATTFCQGGSVVLNANTGTGLSYQWFNNAVAISGATTASYTANASGSYTVVVTNTSTCSATSTATVVTVNALPTATITPATATTFCQGGSVVLNANTGTGLSYQWRLNGTNITGATSSSYTANASGSYTVVVTNTSTCAATSSATVVTVNALPTATITPATATTFCQGGSVVLNANIGTGLTYQWRLNGNPISGATSSSYTANASGSYTVVVTNTSTCSATSAATVVTVNALPTATITAATATTFCQGGSVVLNANTGTGLSYQWQLNGTNITGATSSSYTANASGSYTVVVTNTSTCAATSSATVVTVNALPTATITASSATTFCQGGSVVLNANTGTGLSYQWQLNGTNITGATSSSYTANASGSYTVVVTNTSTCSATSAATVVTVNALPSATITASSATTFCQGGSVVLTANTGTGLSYQWYNNAVIISGATSASYTANASGSYTVVVTNTSACSATSMATVVTVVPNVNYYADADGDGFGDAATLVSTCVQPQGYVTDNTDCDDTSADVNPAATEVCNHIDDDCSGTIDDGLVFDTYYADVDGDTFGDANNSIYECSQPSGYVTNNTDCNDNNANQNTASTEICNGEDDDCDGQIDNGLIFLDYYADLDSDGFGAGAATNSCVDLGAGYVTNNTDCNDNNANQNTASTEICNGEDDDCDGAIDNGITFLDYYADSDGDGFGSGDVISSCSDLGAGYVTNNTDCDDSNSNINSSATETCNTIDDNCDGQIDEGVQTVYFIDNDGDTYGNPSVSILACTQPIGYTPDDTDCNDTDANINPGAEDIGGNGIDENCDGEIDNSIFELNATISLYPNPTRSELNIQVNSSIIGNDLFIFDAVGKLVFKQQLLSTQTTIPVSNFADGNYVVRIGEVVKRFVVEK